MANRNTVVDHKNKQVKTPINRKETNKRTYPN